MCIRDSNELLIKRDKEWFDGVCLPKINEFWEKVLEYRQRPLEDVKALCSSRNSKSKKILNLTEEKPKLNEVQYSKDKSLITNYLDKKEEKPTNEFLFLSDSD